MMKDTGAMNAKHVITPTTSSSDAARLQAARPSTAAAKQPPDRITQYLSIKHPSVALSMNKGNVQRESLKQSEIV